ncbi:hypothetical protein R3P38DRAFT_2601282, partial [Favolaschia claudopus]
MSDVTPAGRGRGVIAGTAEASASAEQEQAEEEEEEDAGQWYMEGKKYVCKQCGKRFSRPSSLKIHVNTHTGAQPYICPHPSCGRSFNVNSNMRRH